MLAHVDPIQLLQDARDHLVSGIGQSIPSDDQIIIGKMRCAEALIKLVLDAHRGAAR